MKYTVVHCADGTVSTEKIEAATPSVALQKSRHFGRMMTAEEVEAAKKSKRK